MILARGTSQVLCSPRLILRFRVVILTVLLFPVALVVPAHMGEALATDVFSARDVAVDVTAGSATNARKAALANGQRKAFRALLERLTLRTNHGDLPFLSDARIAELVSGIEVSDEKTSPVRYLAKITYRFKPDAIRELLSQEGLPFAETRSKPVLVIPVYQLAGTQLLWDDPNPWREAWAGYQHQESLVPFIVPKGDLADIADIGPVQAMAATRKRLDTIARRYGAIDTLVAVAFLTVDPVASRSSLDVSVSRFGLAIHEYTNIFSFTGSHGETIDNLLNHAVAGVAVQVEENWKRDNLMQLDSRQESLIVSIPITGIKYWTDLSKRLDSIAFIRRKEVLSLTRSEVIVGLHFVGSTAQLELALAQSDLNLSQGDTSWILRLEF
ncbi:MAG TPA: hypothetical protein DCP05_02670 [Rhodospirillaceae bacterium]|jgi:hypothetical protein|nr:hypothetical protein [Rhodospirillaceae bacterium]